MGPSGSIHEHFKRGRRAVGVLKALSVFSFGLYSLMGAGLMVGTYLLLYGAQCAESRIKHQPLPTDRVLVFVVVAALAGFCVGSLAQGLAEIRDECAAIGEMPKPCLLKRLGRTTLSAGSAL
jgi:hypothetical protein